MGVRAQASPRPLAHPDLRWVADILWGAPELFVSQEEGAHVTADEVERYVVVPNLKRPRMLLPARSPVAAAAAVMSYNSLRPFPLRVARSAIGRAFRAGIADPLLSGRIVVRLLDGDTSSPGSILLSEHLRQALDVGGAIKLAVGIPRRGPFAKPVVQAFTQAGTAEGYAKVGWNRVTAQLVQTEAAFLAAPPDLRAILVPTMLHQGRWRDQQLSVTAPLPAGVRGYGSLSAGPPLRATREIAEASGTARSALVESAYWHRLRSELSNLLQGAGGRERDVVEATLGRVEARHGDALLLFGRWHGDWVPWNLGTNAGRLVAWDWEHTEPDVPFGFDVLHFLFHVSFIGLGRSLADTIATWTGTAPPALGALDVPATAHAAVTSAYLLTMFARHYRALQAGAVPNPRFYPRILDALDAVAR